jgi:nitrite reductase/ring-hydroxylating ferredoxin subunit
VQCPWHASRFRLSDGHVMRGPATRPQPSYELREEAGRVQIRARSH